MDADVEQLAVVAEVTGRVVVGITDEQWALPTPCAGWSVEDLVRHVAGGNARFAAALRGDPAPAPVSGSAAGLPEAYRRSVRGLLDAFGRPGALRETVTVPFGTVPGAVALHLRITELLVHGWDLARATGVAADFPEEIAEQELEFSLPALADVPPDRSPFAPPEPVPDNAPAIDRLAACLGRRVSAPVAGR